MPLTITSRLSTAMAEISDRVKRSRQKLEEVVSGSTAITAKGIPRARSERSTYTFPSTLLLNKPCGLTSSTTTMMPKRNVLPEVGGNEHGKKVLQYAKSQAQDSRPSEIPHAGHDHNGEPLMSMVVPMRVGLHHTPCKHPSPRPARAAAMIRV